jgi:hypothetical protein
VNNRHEKHHAGRIAITLLILTGVFFVLKTVFRFPLIADDYHYLALLESGRLDPAAFGKYITRLPLWSLLTFGVFKSRFVYLENLSYTFIFAVHGLFLMLFGLRLRQRIFGATDSSLTFLVLVGVFSFFPNHYEILFWPTCWAYIGGLPGLYLGWTAQRRWLKFLCYTASFCFGEMYLLPALALELLNFMFPRTGTSGISKEWRQMVLTFGAWLGAVVVFLLIRKLLTPIFGAYAHPINLSPGRIPLQLWNMLDHYFVLSFYKTFWVPTMLYWCGLGLIFTYGRRQGASDVAQIVKAMVFVVISGSLVFVMGYFTKRALYGADVCVNALLIAYLEQALKRSRQGFKFASVSLIAVACVGLSLMIYDLKSTNARIMDQKAATMAQFLRQCSAPCIVDLSDIPNGLVRGWVMHPDYAASFVDWINAKEGIHKPIVFVPSAPKSDRATSPH